MLKQFAKKLLWGGVFYLIGYILHIFLYPVILAMFSAVLGTENLLINLIPAWPAIVFWIVAYNLRVNQPDVRRGYLASLGDTRPSVKETLVYAIRRQDMLLDCLAFLVILFVYLMSVLAQTQSIWLCLFFFWIYTPLYVVSDALSWYLVHRHWQKDKY